MHKNDDGTREYRSARVPQTPRLSIYATFYLHARIWHPIVNNKVISIFATLSLSSLTMRMVAASEMQAFVSCSHVCVFFSFFYMYSFVVVVVVVMLFLCILWAWVGMKKICARPYNRFGFYFTPIFCAGVKSSI